MILYIILGIYTLPFLLNDDRFSFFSGIRYGFEIRDIRPFYNINQNENRTRLYEPHMETRFQLLVEMDLVVLYEST